MQYERILFPMWCMALFHDLIMLLTFSIHDRLNPQNEAAKRGLERLEKQMKVFSSFFLLKKKKRKKKIRLLNYISLNLLPNIACNLFLLDYISSNLK